jgi:hypothetical protein
VIAAVASGDQCFTGELAAVIEDALEKVLQVPRLLEDPDSLTQSGCAGLLIEVGSGAY